MNDLNIEVLIVVFAVLVIGTVVLIRLRKNSMEEHKKRKHFLKNNFKKLGIGIGLSLGIPIGIGLGLLNDNLAMGISIGPVIGVAFGSVIGKVYEKKYVQNPKETSIMEDKLHRLLFYTIILGVLLLLTVAGFVVFNA